MILELHIQTQVGGVLDVVYSNHASTHKNVQEISEVTEIEKGGLVICTNIRKRGFYRWVYINFFPKVSQNAQELARKKPGSPATLLLL